LRAAYLGPCVATDPDTARSLIKDVLATLPAAAFYWDVLSSNQHARAIARERGFTPQRDLVRMRRGPEIAADGQLTYAIAGFELG